MANKMILRKKYGSPGLANLMGQPLATKAREVRLKVKKPKALPTYRGSFSVKKK